MFSGFPANFTPNSLSAATDYKRMASLFRSNHLIPIIDDSEKATNANPGMLGIQVIPWQSESEIENDIANGIERNVSEN